jgi:hypothetical protein
MWTAAHKKFKEDYKWLASPSNRKDAVRTLKRADLHLKRLAEWLRTDPRVPTIRVEDFKTGRWAQLKATDYLARGQLGWIAGWISEISARGGRPPEAMVARCAEEVAAVFKRETGKFKWLEVGKIIAKAFPETIPKDDGGRDLRLWIYNLVKRNRNRAAKIRKSKVALKDDGSIN